MSLALSDCVLFISLIAISKWSINITFLSTFSGSAGASSINIVSLTCIYASLQSHNLALTLKF